MNVEAVRAYCLAKKGTTESFPFDESTLVLKVMGKIFAILPLDVTEQTINLKCDPDQAVELRETYPDDVFPGYHMNKQHWNTVHCEGGLSDALLKTLIDHSYELIVKSLSKKIQAELATLP